LCTPTSSHTIRRSLLTSFLAPTKKERERRNVEKVKRRRERYYWVLRSVASPSLSSHGGTRLDSCHGQARSPAKPREPRVYDGNGAHSLPRARGPCVPRTRGRIHGNLFSLYKQGFGALSHKFLRLLLRHYGLEQHNLTPLGVLHVAAFVAFCEAYLGIDPHFDL
jgi:hypothetical protein